MVRGPAPTRRRPRERSSSTLGLRDPVAAAEGGAGDAAHGGGSEALSSVLPVLRLGEALPSKRARVSG
ncbi:hypothetical protein [Nocardiopsis sp. NRRL B-16309]|uniref:hypothetical protein n=1 Tax=Nocardiopsis sp. NRRL B-16309 TaxID=1519494 RepID=UPI0006AD8C65|nr:hypothetical protein [Nocardiopsis sp. NRRL B-16309]KOX19647.1 hypothetical protein ADL05_05815 [Nocardiopsis sp. NRRL B-16309]